MLKALLKTIKNRLLLWHPSPDVGWEVKLTELEHVKCKFEFICSRKWEELEDTDSDNARYCSHCDQCVFLAKTTEEIDKLAKEKKCAFFCPEPNGSVEYLDIPPFSGRLISRE